jgi:hypothetical protein
MTTSPTRGETSIFSHPSRRQRSPDSVSARRVLSKSGVASHVGPQKCDFTSISGECTTTPFRRLFDTFNRAPTGGGGRGKSEIFGSEFGTRNPSNCVGLAVLCIWLGLTPRGLETTWAPKWKRARPNRIQCTTGRTIENPRSLALLWKIGMQRRRKHPFSHGVVATARTHMHIRSRSCVSRSLGAACPRRNQELTQPRRVRTGFDETRGLTNTRTKKHTVAKCSQQDQRETKHRTFCSARRATEPGFGICTPRALEIRPRFSLVSTTVRFHEQLRWGHHDGGTNAHLGPAKPPTMYCRNVIENPLSLALLGNFENK